MIQLHESQHGDSTLVALSGKLDASTTPTTEARLLELVREGNKFVAIDFSGVTYLASSGLRMLLVITRQITALEGKLVLCNLDQTMKDTLAVTGFLPYFCLAGTSDEALKVLAE
ncbi:MAG: STAS domain-containing protein [Verrucomicrobiae bacterium]